VLNGTKMWITNAGFADLFTVFAKVDGEKFTAFLVEAGYPGVSTGAEEHKMGLKGSSTRVLNLDGVFVPATNVLGAIGRGHKIAFNILNFGRFKLGVGTVGGSKRTLRIAVEYALERKQFKQPIASFGAIQQKIADMAIQLYALEAMSYRVAGYMDTTIDALDKQAPSYAADMMAAIEEFAVEDSIMKVVGSETADFIADEAVQIHGGYGYSAEYEVERTYRDSRINRIFEGTNEINRMLIPGMILKRTMKGELPLFEVIARAEAVLKQDWEAPPESNPAGLAHEFFVAERSKLLSVYLANLAIQRHMADFKDQQEIMLALADMLMLVYGMDSTLARVQQRADAGDATAVHFAIARAYTADAHSKLVGIAERLAPSLTEPEKLDRRYEGIAKFTVRPRVDLIGAKRVVAAFMLEQPRWSL
jgi:alkylation response protein AidB-like acyl-CoA dehydrogenase